MIDLPDHPAPAAATPALLDFGAELTPSLGGPVQRIDRMGSRFRLSVAMPPMRGATARQWVARLVRGKSAGVRMPWPLLDFDPGLPGDAIVVDGAAAAGRSLPISGAIEGYVFREGQPISVEVGGRHYVYLVTGEVIVDADGEVTLPIEPMLRVSPADGDPVHVGKPMIEGFISGDQWAWDMQQAHFQALTFEVTEAE